MNRGVAASLPAALRLRRFGRRSKNPGRSGRQACFCRCMQKKFEILRAATTFIGVLTAPSTFADIPLSTGLDLIGDLRGGYYLSKREERDGSREDTDQFIGRIRGGLNWKPSEQLSGTVRLAGRYSTRNNHPHFEFFESIPDTDGLRAGDSTVDELFLTYTPSSRWEVSIGRLQTAFELAGVAGGSLDRSDSPDVDITWTDGAHVRYLTETGWNWHLILQRNAAEGPTNVRLPPLTFEDSRSRVSYFAALESIEPYGAIVQRTLDINYLPGTLRTGGGSQDRAEDYLAFVGRLAAQWATGPGDAKLLLGTELGYAPKTPDTAIIGTGTSGRAGGFAWQLQLSILDLFPRHSFAVQYGRADPGWLISPDFRNNEVLREFRYEWKIDERQTFTARVRRRDEMNILVDAARKRQDEDFFLRYAYKF